MTRSLFALFLILLLPSWAYAWHGLSIGTGPGNSASHRFISELDRFYRHRAPELDTALVPLDVGNFADRARELSEGRLDLAILPLGLVKPGASKVKVLAYLWEVVLVPFGPEAGGQAVLASDPIWGLDNGAVLPQAGLKSAQLVSPERFSEAFMGGEPGVFMVEVVGHPRILRGYLGQEIYLRSLSPEVAKGLQNLLPWLYNVSVSYKHRHKTLGYPMVLAARTDVDPEKLGKLYQLLVNMPKDLWPEPYIFKQLVIKRSSSLPGSMRHPARDWKPVEDP